MPTAKEQWLAFAPRPEPLRTGKKYHVFISYRSVNRVWAINLYDVLRSCGHEVFLDQSALVMGGSLVGQLQKGLVQSQAGILIWSSATADSSWVEREYSTMERLTDSGEFHFVPVVIEQAELPVFVQNRVFLDFSGYPDGPNGGDLLRLLHAVVGKPLSPEAAHFATQQDEAARRLMAQIRARVKAGDHDGLMALFNGDPQGQGQAQGQGQGQGRLALETSSAPGCAIAEGLIALRAYSSALEVLDKVQVTFPNSIRPRQLRALALARRAEAGDLMAAQGILGELEELGHRDPETLGIYARTWMDRYALSTDVLHLRKARDLYAEAFEGAQDDFYVGINAAAKSVLLGGAEEVEKGKAFARQVQQIVGSDLVRGDYWKTATVAEVFLILGDYERAATRYAEAVTMAPSEIGSHSTTWLQACRLMAVLKPDDLARADVRRAFAHLPDCSLTQTPFTSS